MSALDESLRRVLMAEGARAAALIDVGTGMVVRAAGDLEADLPAAAASMADEARSAAGSLGAGAAGGDLDEISVTTAGRLYMTKVLDCWRGDVLLLFVDFDRTRTNPALAALQVSELTPALLA